MNTVKALYTTPEDLYQAYLNSEDGKKRWAEAYSLFPKYNSGGKDTNKATDYILDNISTWLYSHTPELNDIDIEAYIDTHGETLFESIYDGLT